MYASPPLRRDNSPTLKRLAQGWARARQEPWTDGLTGSREVRQATSRGTTRSGPSTARHIETGRYHASEGMWALRGQALSSVAAALILSLPVAAFPTHTLASAGGASATLQVVSATPTAAGASSLTATPTPAAASTPTATGTVSVVPTPTSPPSATVTPTATATPPPSATPTSSPYGATVLADGPVAYWRLGETSGTAYKDSTGHTSDATLNSQANATQGLLGAIVNDGDKALRWNSASPYLRVPHNAVLNLGNVLSVEAWVKPSDLNARRTIYSNRLANAAGGFSLDVGPADGTQPGSVTVATPGWYNVITANNVVGTDRWYHVVYVRSGVAVGQQKVYVNGVEVGLAVDSPIAFADNTDDKLIGAGTNIGLQFVGDMDEVAVYNRALTPSQVQAHYTAGTSAGSPATPTPTPPSTPTQTPMATATPTAMATSSPCAPITVEAENGALISGAQASFLVATE